jgi:hypothetical protein
MMTLDRLIASVESELVQGREPVTGQVSAPLLESARLSLVGAREQVARGNVEGELARLASLAHQISDLWPHTSELGATILSHVHERRRSATASHD